MVYMYWRWLDRSPELGRTIGGKGALPDWGCHQTRRGKRTISDDGLKARFAHVKTLQGICTNIEPKYTR